MESAIRHAISNLREAGYPESALGLAAVLNGLSALQERLATVEAANERLTRWRNLAVAAATAGAEQEVFARFAELEAIQPIIQAWKDQVASVEQQLAAAEAALAKEEDSRVHWQGLAYIGMRVIDAVLGNSIAEGTGTTEESMSDNARRAISKDVERYRLLSELYSHEIGGYGRWTVGMCQRVGEAVKGRE